jgi:hypothetical protein
VAYVRKVKTASGATGVQIVWSEHGGKKDISHVGSAPDQTGVALLLAEAQKQIHSGQDLLLGEEDASVSTISVVRTFSSVLWDALEGLWFQLGFDCVDDQVFRQIVLARIVEPTSKLDALRVLDDLGINPPGKTSLYRALRRCQDQDYRSMLEQACFVQAATKGLGLLLYDVTTLLCRRRHKSVYADILVMPMFGVFGLVSVV